MISAIALQMSCVAALLRLAVAAIVLSRSEQGTGAIYGTTLVDSLVKLVDALAGAGIELIGEGAASSGGSRGVRLKSSNGSGAS
jgi:hypothetical protein